MDGVRESARISVFPQFINLTLLVACPYVHLTTLAHKEGAQLSIDQRQGGRERNRRVALRPGRCKSSKITGRSTLPLEALEETKFSCYGQSESTQHPKRNTVCIFPCAWCPSHDISQGTTKSILQTCCRFFFCPSPAQLPPQTSSTNKTPPPAPLRVLSIASKPFIPLSARSAPVVSTKPAILFALASADPGVGTGAGAGASVLEYFTRMLHSGRGRRGQAGGGGGVFNPLRERRPSTCPEGFLLVMDTEDVQCL